MANEAIGALGLVGGLFFLVIICIIAVITLSILSFIFWIFMIIDCAKRNFKNESDKIIWILILVFLGAIGALVYYFVIKKPDKH